MCRSNLPTDALVRVSTRATQKFCFAIFHFLPFWRRLGSRGYTPFSKCVIHYDTFSTSAAKMSWALPRGMRLLRKPIPPCSVGGVCPHPHKTVWPSAFRNRICFKLPPTGREDHRILSANHLQICGFSDGDESWVGVV